MSRARNLLVLLIAVSFSLTGCASGSQRAAPRPSLPPRPIVAWIDAAWMKSDLADPVQAELVMRGLHDSGFTVAAFESMDWMGVPTATIAEPLRARARAAGLRTAAIVPCFTPPHGTPAERLSQFARWNGTEWEIVPLAPPRLSPALAINQAELLNHVGTLKDPWVILTGFGFEDQFADLGPEARRVFEAWSASPARNWPVDILGPQPPRLPWGPEGRGPRWESWMLWRADLLSQILVRLRGELPNETSLIVAVDAPYQVHQRQGLNWVDATTTVIADHGWLPLEYVATSVVHLVDAYALIFWEPSLVRREEALRQDYAWWASVEGSASASVSLLPTSVKTWSTVVLDDSAAMGRSIDAARNVGGGVLLVGLRPYTQDAAGWQRLRQSLQ